MHLDENDIVEAINPEVTKKEGKQRVQEGCLSCPNVWGYVTRPMSCHLKAQDRNGNWFERDFTDLGATDSYYYKAVLWAVEQGITNGTGADTFSPNATVTRGQVVTFLFRFEKAAAGDENPFVDVDEDAYYADAVAWAVEEGITNGTSDTTFSPDNNCTRGQIVTFLYRDMAN